EDAHPDGVLHLPRPVRHRAGPRAHQHLQDVLIRSSRLRQPPSLAALIGGVVAFVSLLIGLGPLNDNSFLTHLATGRIMWETHHIPHSDPYTFTAPGKSWVVQSWLASLLYGATDNWWGPAGLLLLMGVSAAAVGTLVWTLTR